MTSGMLWGSFVRMVLEVTHGRISHEHWKHTGAVLHRFTRYRQLQGRCLRDVTQIDVDLYFAARRRDMWRGRSIGVITLNNEARILNQWLRRAGPKGRTRRDRLNWSLMPEPPYAATEIEPLREVTTVTEEQLHWFRKAADQATYPRLKKCSAPTFWRAALALALVTALRRRALLLIPRPDDDTLLTRREIFLPAHLNKTNADLRISLGTPEMAQLLYSLPSRVGSPILPWLKAGGSPSSASQFSRWWMDLQIRAGVPEAMRFHLKALRATAATTTAKQFGDTVAKSKLGHSPNTNTLHRNYLHRHVSEQDVAASVRLAGIALHAMG